MAAEHLPLSIKHPAVNYYDSSASQGAHSNVESLIKRTKGVRNRFGITSAICSICLGKMVLLAIVKMDTNNKPLARTLTAGVKNVIRKPSIRTEIPAESKAIAHL